MKKKTKKRSPNSAKANYRALEVTTLGWFAGLVEAPRKHRRRIADGLRQLATVCDAIDGKLGG